MISASPRRPTRSTIVALLPLAAMIVATGAAAQERNERGARVGNRCALYGPAFRDIGEGTCVRVSNQIGAEPGGNGHVRVELGGRAGPLGSLPSVGPLGGMWSGGTANAALRSDRAGMLPGAADAQHLRVQGSYSR